MPIHFALLCSILPELVDLYFKKVSSYEVLCIKDWAGFLILDCPRLEVRKETNENKMTKPQS